MHLSTARNIHHSPLSVLPWWAVFASYAPNRFLGADTVKPAFLTPGLFTKPEACAIAAQADSNPRPPPPCDSQPGSLH